MSRFMRVLLADTEDTWTQIFRTQGQQYPRPNLCCSATRRSLAAASDSRRWDRSIAPPIAACISTSPSSRKLDTRFGAPGDFAQAYVGAHEVGHHVQNVTGSLEQRGPAATPGRCAWNCRLTGYAGCGPLRRQTWRRRRSGRAGGPRRRCRDRRRPPAASVRRTRVARVVHTRVFSAARGVVPAWPLNGACRRVRHVRQIKDGSKKKRDYRRH